MDTHRCGDCQTEFDSYESFLIHKLLIERYKLTLESSERIPTLRLPKFIKLNETSRLNCEKGNEISKPVPIPTGNNGQSKDKSESAPLSSPVFEAAYSPIVEVVVDAAHSEDVSDDDISIGSQPESLRIDEGVGGKDTSSPQSEPEPTSELENDQKKEYYCKHCNRYYKTKVVLRVHEETVHSSVRPHVCTTCRQGFKTKGSLVRHTRTHTGERPFSCSQCKRAFLDSGTLARHVNRVHRKLLFRQARDVKVYITRLDSETPNVTGGDGS